MWDNKQMASEKTHCSSKQQDQLTSIYSYKPRQHDGKTQIKQLVTFPYSKQA